MSGGAEPTLVDAGFLPESESPVSAEHATVLAATLDEDPAILAGGRLPVLWHWAFFPPAVPTAALGDDGHPRRRPEMAAFGQRLWGGSRVTQHHPLHLGRPAQRSTVLERTARKSGSAGDFWLLTVHHTIRQAEALCIEEHHDLVLRAPAPLPPPGPERDAAPDGRWRQAVNVDPRLLFRYSALTFNSHRIHYDLPYATHVEGYSGLVVHGPLLATLLTCFLRRESGREARIVRFRARAPVVAGHRFWLTGEQEAEVATLRVVRGDHVVALDLEAQLEP